MTNKVARQKILTIIALCAMTISQPIFDIIEQNPEFLAVRYLSASEIIIYAVLIGVLMPVLLGLIVYIIDKYIFINVDLAFWFLFNLLVFILAFMALKYIIYVFELSRIIVALVLVLGASYAYIKYNLVKDFFEVLSILVIIFPIYFLFFTPVAAVIKSSNYYFEKQDYFYGGIKNSKNVVMIVLDELSLVTLLDEQENIDSRNFENISNFLRSATWYKNATTVSSSTVKAVPSILTGDYPHVPNASMNRNKSKRSVHDWLGLPIYQDHPDNVFTLLSKSHLLKVKESASSLCPYPLCKNEFSVSRKKHNLRILFADTFYTYLHLIGMSVIKNHIPNVQMGWVGFDDSHIESDRKYIFQNFVSSIENKNEDPQFIFLHSILPHMPWIYSKDGELNGYDRVPGLSSKVWTKDKNVLSEAYNLYFNQTKFVDLLLGKLFDKLKQQQLYDDSLIIITSDHGVTIQPGMNAREITPDSIVDIMSVPLFIHYPGQIKPKVDNRYASVIDIVPTIADVLKVERNYGYSGYSLLSDKVRDGRSLRFYRFKNNDGVNKDLTIDFTAQFWDSSINRKYMYLN